MSPFWVKVTIVAAVVTLGWFIWFLIDKLRQKKERQKLKEDLREVVREELHVYLDGLPEIKDRKKVRLLREGLRAMRKYLHGEAIEKFRECFPLASNDGERCALLNLIGISQYKKCAFQEAEQTFLKMNSIAERANLKFALSDALGNIGIVYLSLDKREDALDSLQRAFELDGQINNKAGQAARAIGIGNVYFQEGDFQTAFEYYEEALKMAEDARDFEIQAMALGNMGNVYRKQGDQKEGDRSYYLKARDAHLQSLKIAKGIETRANQIGNLGTIYRLLGELEEALKYSLRSLEINKGIGRRENEAIDLRNICAIYSDLGRFKEAIDYCRNASDIFQQIGSMHMVEDCNRSISIIRAKLEEQKK